VSRSVANYGMWPDQRNKQKKNVENREQENVYFTHMGRRPRRAELNKILQFSSSHQRNQSTKFRNDW